MVKSLLKRGLLVGALAGLVSGVFAFVFGEPRIQDAIDIEETASASASVQPVLAHISDWAVSRPQQRAGLFLATMLYGACIGTIFALVFAAVRGRGGARDDWRLSVAVAGGLFVAMVLVPFLKYPANPPAVGDPDTITERTLLYLAMLVGGLLSLLAAVRVLWSVADGAAPWKRPVYGVGTFVALTGLLAIVLPGIDEVPAGFPASLLWEFRLSSLGSQVVLWTALGVGFGILSLRAATAEGPGRGSIDGTSRGSLSTECAASF